MAHRLQHAIDGTVVIPVNAGGRMRAIHHVGSAGADGQKSGARQRLAGCRLGVFTNLWNMALLFDADAR
jgi:hypothetical protein